MGLFKKIGRVIKKAGKQASVNLKHAPEAFNQIGQAGALPLHLVGGTISGGLSAAAPVLEQATGILAANPALAGLAGTALGVPGLGGLFSGGAPGGGGEMVTGSPFSPPPESPGIPMWVWLAGAGAALLGLILFLRRKA